MLGKYINSQVFTFGRLKDLIMFGRTLFLFYFQNFREHVCDYKGTVKFSLEDTKDIASCQGACTSYMPECKFFTYDSERRLCELRDSGERECEMVRGTPHPDFEKCKQDGFIHWP